MSQDQLNNANAPCSRENCASCHEREGGKGVVATHPDIARTGAHLDLGRGTGRTTRLAVHHAELALSAPGRWVKVIDHHPTVAACMYLATKVDRLLIELNVPHTVRMDPPRVMVFAVERKEQP